MVVHHRVSALRQLSHILLMVGVVLALFWAFGPPSSTKDESEKQPERAQVRDFPFIPQACFLSAAQLATIPLVDGFEYPCGSTEGAFIYDAQALGSGNAKRGGKHTGADLNGIGGGASDEGLPVYAVARGMVVYAGTPSKDWGRVVVVAHRLPDGRVVQSLYAHLAESLPRLGAVLARGEQLGTIGGADGLYVPHLHLELVQSLRVAAAQPGYLPELPAHYLSLADLIAAYPAPAFGDSFHSLRRAYARASMQLVAP